MARAKNMLTTHCPVCGAEMMMYPATAKRRETCSLKCRGDVAYRFAKHDKRRDGECLVWTGLVTSDGYGLIRVGKRKRLVHRVAYRLTHGADALPDDVILLHKCDNPPCVNVSHLTPGTHADNVHDCMTKGRGDCPKAEEHPHAKLTVDDVLSIRARIAGGEKGVDLAKEFGVWPSAISKAKNGRTWRELRRAS